MSGKDAIRGYVYQTIVSVIKAFTVPDWESVLIEPKTLDDKVDILWENTIGEIIVQQVKSSEINFSKPEIVRTLEALIKDQPNAKKFELILVGHFASGTDTFINSINKRKNNATGNTIVDAHLSKIEVDKITFSTIMMENSIRDNLNKFLSSYGYNLPHPAVSLIADGLVYQFFYRSIINEKTKKKDATEDLLSWAKLVYPKVFSQYSKEAKLALKFYDVITHEFIDKLSPINFTFERLNFIIKQKEKVEQAFKECDQIRLCPRQTVPEEGFSSISQQLTKLSMNLFGDAKPADIYPEWQTFITEKLLLYFNIRVDEAFFYVGNLMIRNSLNMLFQGPEYQGTENEKKKGELLDDLYFTLKTLYECNCFIQYVNEYYILPIAVENSGENYDEEIVVVISLPDSVEILSSETLYMPENNDALKLFIDNNFFENYFLIPGDSFIEAYDGFHMPRFDEHTIGLESIAAISGSSKKREYYQKMFKRDFNRIFQYDIFYDIKDKITVKCEIKPNEKKALPALLLMKSPETFRLEYSIRTKKSSTIHKGELILNAMD